MDKKKKESQTKKSSAGTHRDMKKEFNLPATYENFFTLNLDLLFLGDKSGKLIRMSKEWENVLGYAIEELENTPILDYIPPEDISRVADLIEHIDDTAGIFHLTVRFCAKDGRHHYIELKGQVQGEYVYCAARDITERIELAQSLKRNNTLLQTIMDHAPVSIYINYPGEEPDFYNKYMRENFAMTEEETLLVGLTDEDVLQKGFQGSYEEEITFKDGKKHIIETVKTRLYKEDGSILGTLGIGLDITKRKEDEEALRMSETKHQFLSYHDQMTGLYNRRYYEEELKTINTEGNYPITLVMADVNGLKLTNDAFGHAFGDRMLVTFADILKKECRSGDVIARIGGDEFVLLLPRTNTVQAEKIVNRIQKILIDTVVDKVKLSVSFGWQTKYAQSEEFDDIYKQAEDAMYRRKMLEGRSYKSETIKLITKSLYEKFKGEQLHCERVSSLCKQLGAALGMDSDDIKELGLAGLLHDIGKIGINTDILNKAERLKEEEWQEIRRHPEIGYHILRSVNEFAELAEYVLAHHERMDGKGYPVGLKGADIPQKARILHIAEAYEVMTGEHPYRKKISQKEAILELEKNSGTEFDPEIVKCFIEKVIK